MQDNTTPFIIGIDLDGVVGKYTEGLRSHLAQEHNLTPEQALQRFPGPEDYAFRSWGFENLDHFFTVHGKAVDLGLYENMEQIEGAVETIRRLKDEGNFIRVITSRFVLKGQNFKVVTQTARFLDRIKLPYHDIMFTARKGDVHADIYIDDAPSNIQTFQKLNKNYIIYTQPYNLTLEGPRANNWNEIYQLIQQTKNNTQNG